MSKTATRDLSKLTIAFPTLVEKVKSFAEAPSEIHVVPCGVWDHPAYGLIEITPANISEIVANFNAKVRLDLPITAGHDNGMSGGELPAIGWFTGLIDRGVQGLFGTVNWTDEGKKLLADGAFKYFSPELYMQYEDPETHRVYNYVLVGGALTNSPYFKELEPVVMSFSEPSIMHKHDKPNPTMNIKDIVAKKVTELNADEKSFLKANKSELSAEQAEAFKTVFSEKTAEEIAAEEKATGDANEAAGKNRDGSAKAVVASDKDLAKGKITMSEVEVAALKDAADKGALAFAELDLMKSEKAIAALLFSETNKTGKILPKEKDAALAFFSTLNKTQRDQFVNILSKIPATAIFSEKGAADTGTEANNDATLVFNEINGLVKDYLKENKGVKFSEGLRRVLALNPALAAKYQASGEQKA